jgi:hypothetical protein
MSSEFPFLFTLVPDVRLLCCGSRVGMAMVAQTCRWAARHWRRRRAKYAKTVPLVEGAVIENVVTVVRHLLSACSKETLVRCMIRAVHTGSYAIFQDVESELCGRDAKNGDLFARCCVSGSDRTLFLSRALDVASWTVQQRKEIDRILVFSGDDVDIWLHVGGTWAKLPGFVGAAPRWGLRVALDRVDTARDVFERELLHVLEQVPDASRAEARAALIHTGGDIVEAILVLSSLL